jgi:hypothetical protein
MAEAAKKRIRIGKMQSTVIVGIAVGVDFVQGLLTISAIGLIVNTFISIFIWLMFWFWFRLNGIGFLNGKVVLKTVAMWGAGIIELMPVINNIPAWTVSIVIMLIIVRIEDVGIGQIGSLNKLLAKKTGLNMDDVSMENNKMSVRSNRKRNKSRSITKTATKGVLRGARKAILKV